ncbi:nucleolar protein 58-like isoform X1 [Zingiber officinale]|uniref:nucleolar protein 58-like isoform X1 n=1 Tax=Zingiber officinale TaxID=94328 RepID=UPI001C4CC827|nr:nucleolar protein 58-like isoform X1 [Zingiber officinale]
MRRLVTHLSNERVIRDFAVPKMAESEEALGSLTEDERRALRGSKFAPLPAPPPSAFHSQPRLAHPNGPMTTNKAAALAKFLERKLQQPDGLSSLDPKHVELAVKNAKEVAVPSKGTSSAFRSKIRHVASFEDSDSEVFQVPSWKKTTQKGPDIDTFEELDRAEKKKKRKKTKREFEADNAEEKKKKKKKKKKEKKKKVLRSPKTHKTGK